MTKFASLLKNQKVYQTNTKIHALESYCDISLTFNSETRQFEVKELVDGKILTTYFYSVLAATDSYRISLERRGITV